MNDEQCQCLIDAIDRLTDSVSRASELVGEAIDGLYIIDIESLEKRLDRLIEAIYDAAEREH